MNRTISKLCSIISRTSDSNYEASEAPGSLTTSARCCHEAGQPDPSCPDPVKREKAAGVQPVAEPDFYKASDSLSSRYNSIPSDSLDHEQPLDGNDSDQKDCQHRDNRSREKGSTRGTNSGGGGFSSLTGGSSGGIKVETTMTTRRNEKAKERNLTIAAMATVKAPTTTKKTKKTKAKNSAKKRQKVRHSHGCQKSRLQT